MTDDSHPGPEPPPGNAKYIMVFVALCVLTAASFFTYSEGWPWKEHPEVGRTFMMAVSCTKAALVILFFMHLKYETGAWKYVLTIPAAMMSVFLVMALVPDVMLRGRRAAPEQFPNIPNPALAQPVDAAAEHPPAAAADHGEASH
ncbi:MAG: cytochrome C oxidase subunit IV family protein [Planctomycetales bacterium]|nr:cytochrome C oxidase subunit IV family protein [Planctomycetales bacterium]